MSGPGDPNPALDPRLATPAATLAPGDRAPSFLLPDQSGAMRDFYERARGLPLVLALAPDDAGLRELQAAAAPFAAAGIDRLALREAETQAIAATADQLDLDFPLLADPKGKILAGFRRAAGLPADRPAFLLLDANQRLIDIGFDVGAMAAWAMARLAQIGAPGDSATHNALAPVLILPRVLDPAACRALIERWGGAHQEGSVLSIVQGEETERVYHQLKKRLDHAIDDPALAKSLVAILGRRLAPELDKAFCFRGFAFERFNVTCYDAERGDYFRRHRDNRSASTANRRFALTLNLNEDFAGGELAFPEYGPQRYKPPAGGAILFSCSLLHEALPVTAGRRFTLLSFLREPTPAPGSAARP